MQVKSRDYQLDIWRAIAIIAVVFYHSFLFLEYYSLVPETYVLLNKALFPVLLPPFFALSGMLHAKSLQLSWRDLFRQRIAPLLYLMAIWTVIRWVYFGYVQDNVRTPEEGKDLMQFVWMWVKPNTGLWFLWVLAIYLVVAKLVLSVPKVIVLTVAAALTLIVFGSWLVFDGIAYRNLLQYFTFYMAGVYYGRAMAQAASSKSVTVFLIAFAAYSVLFITRHLGLHLEAGLWRLLMAFTGIMWMAALASLIAKTFLKEPVGFLGRNTISVYVTHVIPIAIFSLLFAALPKTALIVYLGLPALIVLSTLSSLAIQKVAEVAGAGFLYHYPFSQKKMPGNKPAAA
ncbi:acyltransferase [Agrobacterium sp. AGB01]|uniref:acyltransferase family protein n=1 Tax=Agrobacterium sp. AGB01 TaxID=2769302 RepID=UPI00177F9630|nr:acyltransferase [Agrobacterium sp. AGB01]MBD9390670.1 acyltransferase [Agrobacterium sp. AGB01]